MGLNGREQDGMCDMAGAGSEGSSTWETKAYQRQLKRHVQGSEHRFAAIVPPELKNICMAEAQSLGLAGAVLSEAGIEFTGTLSDCYAANLWLRTASRVLCRVQEFRAGAAEDLFRRVASFRWELWLSHRLPMRIEGHVFNSRIQSSSLVESTVRAGIAKRFHHVGLTPPPPDVQGLPGFPEPIGQDADGLTQRVLVHVATNRCQVSIDTTGDHLHERGYRLRHTGAPLRETLAAGILMKCGWKGSVPLIDGMTGSGTLAVEGALISRRLPPGMGRSFLFQWWPSFNDRLWGHLRQKAVDHSRPGVRASIVGVDGNMQAIDVAQENAARAGVGDGIQWLHMDFFDMNPMGVCGAPGLLILNPPYGKRLQGQDRGIYEKVGAHLRRAYEGWQVAVLAPEEHLALALKLRSARFWRLRHGGLPILVVMARI